MTNTVTLEFRKISDDQNAFVALVGLNRPDSANAFSGEMITELTSTFDKVAASDDCRAMVLFGHGKHFCAGADLGWMKESAKLSLDENVEDAKKLIRMFEALRAIPVPTLCALHGAAFGGAVGLVACCDVVVADASAKLCLSEVRVGLIPAVIVPYVAKRLPFGALRRFGLSGQVIKVDTARELGLVDYSSITPDFRATVKVELNHLLAASPAAQRRLKKLLSTLEDEQFAQSDATAKAIAECRTSAEGQAGLKAFFDKSEAPWKLQVADNWDWK